MNDINSELAVMKARAQAIGDELKLAGYDVFQSYATDRGLPDDDVYRLGLIELDVYDGGDGTVEGHLGSIWYDAGGVIIKGDRLQNLCASGVLQSFPMN